MRPLTQLNIILQSLEADIQVAFAKAWDVYQRMVAEEAKQRYTRAPTAQERACWPAHIPPHGPCVVCGNPASTYRWGQWVSKWDSESNIRVTAGTTRWQDFDSCYSVGWMPLCCECVSTLDTGGSVTIHSKGYHRTGRTPLMRGRPPQPRGYIHG